MGLTVTKTINGSTTILKVDGELDITTISIMDKWLDEMGEIDSLILDLSQLEFIDSTGIGSIMNAIFQGREMNYTVKLEGIKKGTHEIFETVGLYQILQTIQGEGE